MDHSLASAVALLLFVGGCGSTEETPPGRPLTAPAAPTEPPPTTPPPPEDPCAPMIAEVTEILESGSTDCTETSDCGCYNGGMGPRSGCGGVANQATLDRLAPLAARFQASDCPTVDCAAWRCTPACEVGHCRNTSSGGGLAGPSP